MRNRYVNVITKPWSAGGYYVDVLDVDSGLDIFRFEVDMHDYTTRPTTVFEAMTDKDHQALVALHEGGVVTPEAVEKIIKGIERRYLREERKREREKKAKARKILRKNGIGWF